MLAVLAAIALGVGVVSTPELVAEEARFVQARKAETVVQVADIQAADYRSGGELGL